MGAAVSSSHVVSATPSSAGRCSHSPSAPRWGALPWETVLHEFLQHGFFPWASVLNELLQCWFLAWGAIHQAQTAPARVPLRSPANKPVPVQAPFSMGPQVLPEAYSRMSFPWGLSFPWVSPCPGQEILHSLQVL